MNTHAHWLPLQQDAMRLVVGASSGMFGVDRLQLSTRGMIMYTLDAVWCNNETKCYKTIKMASRAPVLSKVSRQMRVCVRTLHRQNIHMCNLAS